MCPPGFHQNLLDLPGWQQQIHCCYATNQN
jgi:hypothetical protein